MRILLVLAIVCFAISGFASAELTYSYSDAKYVYCSTQGHGSIIDLQNTDLTQDGSSAIRIGYKSCAPHSQVTWDQKNYPVNVKISLHGQYKVPTPDLAISGTQFDTNVSTSDVFNGVNGLEVEISFGHSIFIPSHYASGVVNGNSGECFFIKTIETDGLPFSLQCN